MDENKRLRQLLKREWNAVNICAILLSTNCLGSTEQGLSDAQIDGTASEVRDTDIANELESKLGTRKPCKPGGCCGVSASVYEAQSGSSVSPAMSTHEQQPQIFPIEPLPTSASLSSTNYHYPPIAGTYPLHPATADYPFDFAASFDWQDPLQHPNPTNVPPLSESVPSTSSSSCQVAASAVRLMRPDLGPELEEELCCGTGEDCTVSNDCIFSIMDRYSNGT